MEESVPGIKASQQRFEAYDEESRGTCHSVLSAMAESEKGKLHESLGYGPTDLIIMMMMNLVNGKTGPAVLK